MKARTLECVGGPLDGELRDALSPKVEIPRESKVLRRGATEAEPYMGRVIGVYEVRLLGPERVLWWVGER